MPRLPNSTYDGSELPGSMLCCLAIRSFVLWYEWQRNSARALTQSPGDLIWDSCHPPRCCKGQEGGPLSLFTCASVGNTAALVTFHPSARLVHGSLARL
jgi:hypothetical protein